MKHKKLPITIAILTKNEELVINDAIQSVKNYFNEVIVLDSFSKDKTVNIVNKNKIKLFKKKFVDYASQRNYVLQKLKLKNKWIFFLDADEIIPISLINELRKKIHELNDINIGMIYFRRKDYFLDKGLKRSSGYPTWFGRLSRVNAVKIKRKVNEEYMTNLKVLRFDSHIIHFPFKKGITSWIERHNYYSSLEAEIQTNKTNIEFKNIFSQDPNTRRSQIKKIYASLPFKPLLMFVYLYIFRMGFLDGKPGLYFAFLRSYYEFMIILKINENK